MDKRRGMGGMFEEPKSTSSPEPEGFLDKVVAFIKGLQREPKFQEGGDALRVGWLRWLIRTGKVFGCIIVALLLYRVVMLVHNKPGEWIVTQNVYDLPFMKQGLAKEPLTPGYNHVIPVLQVTHTLPRHLVAVEYDRNSVQYKQAYKGDKISYFPVQSVSSTDGFTVANDTGAILRIFDPIKVLEIYGPGDLFLKKGVLPLSDNAYKMSLGLLETEMYFKFPWLRWALSNGDEVDFKRAYDSLQILLARAKKEYEESKKENRALDESTFAKDLRQLELGVKIAERGMKGEKISARQLLNRDLEPNGIKVVFVPSLYFSFNDDIQKKIVDKVGNEQKTEVNKALAALNEANAQLLKTKTEGQQSVNVLASVGTKYEKQKSGETERYQRVKESEGAKKKELAEAYKTRKEKEALEFAGSENWVNQQTVEAFEGTQFILTTPGEFQKTIESWGK